MKNPCYVSILKGMLTKFRTSLTCRGLAMLRDGYPGYPSLLGNLASMVG